MNKRDLPTLSLWKEYIGLADCYKSVLPCPHSFAMWLFYSSYQKLESISSLCIWDALSNRMWQKWCCGLFLSLKRSWSFCSGLLGTLDSHGVEVRVQPHLEVTGIASLKGQMWMESSPTKLSDDSSHMSDSKLDDQKIAWLPTRRILRNLEMYYFKTRFWTRL